MDKVHEYIINNWKNTIKLPDPKSKTTSFLPKPFTTPCVNVCFTNFFYWDTYFTNIGLINDGLLDQAINNLDDISALINTYGYMPNADHLLYRSQPPVFVRGVYDLYNVTKNKDHILKYVDSIKKEFDFFKKYRLKNNTLYQYSSEEPKEGKDWYYDEFNKRLNGYTDSERKIEKYDMCTDLLGIAESGWDFNPRFTTKDSRFRSSHFYHLELNCLLYDAYKKASYLFKEVGMNNYAEEYEKYSEFLLKTLNETLFDESKELYLDYNFVDNKFSEIISAASFYPFALGISKNKESALKTYNFLMLEHGISACSYRGDVTYFQWDYPAMWPTNMYFAYLAMKNVGADKEANIIRDKYLDTIRCEFDKSGKLWEKYDAKTGRVSVTLEYSTPPMMGWTAGIYDYFLKEKGEN